MKDYLKWLRHEKENKCEDVVYRLRQARKRLTPIIDDIIVSTVELILKGDDRFINEQTLTAKQYQDVVWTTQMLKDIESEFGMGDKGYQLPNTNIIVSNVLEDRDKCVVIDEETVIELLQVYEQMGVIIQRLVNEGVTVPRTPTGTKSSSKSIIFKSSKQEVAPSTTDKHETTETTEESDKDADRLERKSTLSALLDSSSGNLSQKPVNKSVSKKSSGNLSKRSINKSISKKSEIKMGRDKEVTAIDQTCEPSIFIKIQCCSELSDQEYGNAPVISCAKSCTSQYHVKLDGEPVTLKMNQTKAKDGTVYCINTGQDDGGEDIRIIITQCPECKSTVIGSSNKISDVLGESHESITLHGKQGDEAKMSYSSSDENLCKCRQKGQTCINICDEFTSPCRCKMDVVLDTDSVDKSIVKVRTPSQTSKEEIGTTPSPSSKEVIDTTPEEKPSKTSVVEIDEKLSSIIKTPEPLPPLTRRKVCSSMEFDVTKAQTRLREHEIEHTNAHIVVELKKLGVDQILRACRPAKCCRRAILNERQRTALPYSVSLKSLPLMGNDVEVIKQSIEMSVKKITNSPDLTQAHKEKLAYYVDLGKDDFRLHSNPWVVPVYDLKLAPGPSRIQDRFFVLKNVGVPKQLESVARLIGAINSEINGGESLNKEDKYFVVKKPITVRAPTSEESETEEPRRKVFRRKVKTNTKKLKFKQYQDNSSSSRTIYRSRNMWSSISNEDWRLIVCEEQQRLSLSRQDSTDCSSILNTQINKIKKSVATECSKSLLNATTLSLKKSVACGMSCPNLDSEVGAVDTAVNTQNSISLIIAVNEPVTKVASQTKTEMCGDHTVTSLTKIFDHCLKKLNRRRQRALTRKKCGTTICINKRLPRPKSMPALKFKVLEVPSLRRVQSFDKIFGGKPICKRAKLEDDIREYLHRETIKTELSTKPKTNAKKLEYYVGLVNGDLIWSQNYDTYYNYSNETPPKTPVEDPMYIRRGGARVEDTRHNRQVPPVENPRYIGRVTPVEDPMYVRRVNAEESRRGQPTPITPEADDTGSIISELPQEDLMHARSRARPQTEAGPNTASPAQQAFSTFSMGPENHDEPWAPHVVSETSLPRIREAVQKQDVQQLEARPVSEEKLVPETKPVKKPKNVCSEKTLCSTNKCTDCKTKKCSEKKCNPKDIVISITKVKNKGICVEAIAPKACTKEVCELYKNKNLVNEKAGTSKVRETECEKYKFTAKDNIDIYINNNKVCVGNKNKGKKTTPGKEEKKQK